MQPAARSVTRLRVSLFRADVIPQNRFSGASVFFYPYLLDANSAPSNFRGTAPRSNTVKEYTARIDHQITSKQRDLLAWNLDP